MSSDKPLYSTADPFGRPSWDEWAIGLAFAVAARADCRRKLCGAVILNTDHRVISTGYNGTAPGRDGCLAGNCPRGRLSYVEVAEGSDYDKPGSKGYCIATHAEMNALLYADPLHLNGATMACTIKPCNWCYKIIANTQIARIVYPVLSLGRMGVDEYWRCQQYNIPVELTVDLV